LYLLCFEIKSEAQRPELQMGGGPHSMNGAYAYVALLTNLGAMTGLPRRCAAMVSIAKRVPLGRVRCFKNHAVSTLMKAARMPRSVHGFIGSVTIKKRS